MPQPYCLEMLGARYVGNAPATERCQVRNGKNGAAFIVRKKR